MKTNIDKVIFRSKSPKTVIAILRDVIHHGFSFTISLTRFKHFLILIPIILVSIHPDFHILDRFTAHGIKHHAIKFTSITIGKSTDTCHAHLVRIFTSISLKSENVPTSRKSDIYAVCTLDRKIILNTSLISSIATKSEIHSLYYLTRLLRYFLPTILTLNHTIILTNDESSIRGVPIIQNIAKRFVRNTIMYIIRPSNRKTWFKQFTFLIDIIVQIMRLRIFLLHLTPISDMVICILRIIIVGFEIHKHILYSGYSICVTKCTIHFLYICIK